jgi:hypothetical protein
MRASYAQVLARSPSFERRAEMAAGYLDFARQAGPESHAAALDAARRAERISSDPQQKRVIQSLRLTLEAEDLMRQGVVDQTLLTRAIELDPGNLRPRSLRASAEHGETEKKSLTARFSAAAVIAGLALAAILAIAFRRRAPRPTPPPPTAGPES